MDYGLGESADALRLRLRSLIEEQVPDDFLGAFTSDPEDVALTQRFCKTLAAEGLLALAWPTEYGGGGGTGGGQTGGREGRGGGAAPWGTRRWCARRCGPITSRVARSTWASTGSARH